MSKFGEVQDKISGPLAIINVGADVARTDVSGLFQFAALINLNLAVRHRSRCPPPPPPPPQHTHAWEERHL